MPAKSKAQQKAAGLALSAKRGGFPVSKLRGSALSMYKSMNAKQLGELAETPTKGLPGRLTKKERLTKKTRKKMKKALFKGRKKK